ncbi:MAG: hypothetical protein QXG52_05075, partial [Candidatus Caldarchaeum sp.]
LSKADLYFQRINRTQAWHYLRYAIALMTAGVAASRKTTPTRYLKFSYPESIRFLAQTKSVREKIDEISEKIAAKLHVSRRKTKTEILPFVKIIVANGDKKMAEYFGLSREDVEFLKTGESRKQRARGSG